MKALNVVLLLHTGKKLNNEPYTLKHETKLYGIISQKTKILNTDLSTQFLSVHSQNL
jgi:hypothetical protein